MEVWAIALALASVLAAWWAARTPEVQVPGTDPVFHYEGRWSKGLADWPCTAVRFDVEAERAGAVQLLWAGRWSRFQISVEQASTEHWGPWLLSWRRAAAWIPHEGRFTVVLRKLSGSHPLGTGWAASISEPWAVLGVELPEHLHLKPARRGERRIEFVGSQDMLGGLWAWQQNCEAAYPGLLAKELEAEYQVEALFGLGVVQNAHEEYLVGAETFGFYEPRVLASRASSKLKDTSAQLVVVHLGGEDFSKQGPNEHTFRVVYSKILRSIIQSHGGFHGDLSMLCLCGGSFQRCHAVQDAVRHFHETLEQYTENATVRVEYVSAPGEPGAALAEALLPRIRSFMAW